jgi:hypothetical protein
MSLYSDVVESYESSRPNAESFIASVKEYIEPKIKEIASKGKRSLTLKIDDLPELLKENFKSFLKVMRQEGFNISYSYEEVCISGWARDDVFRLLWF